MKNKLLIVIALSWCAITFGQITGTKYIPGDYPTIAAAVADLNTAGVGTGGVTFSVSPGYTEDITTPLFITATGTPGDPILFTKDLPVKSPTTANPLVRRTDAGTITTAFFEAQGDAVILIEGGDFITFDGIDVQTTSDGIEYGFYLRRASATNGCKNVTIKNANITMTKGASPYVIGIFSSNNDASSPVTTTPGITLTSSGGRTENLVITGNTISNVFTGVAVRGFNHSTTPWDLMDQNTVIGALNAGNAIQNFGGNSTANTVGVHLYYQTSPNISYNTIDNVAGGGTDATGAIYGIWHQLSSNVGNFVASNNVFIFGENSTSGGIIGIQATPAGQPANSILIQNNTFAINTFSCTGSMNLISCSGANANNITVTGNSTVGTITKTNASSGSFYGYIKTSGTPTGGSQTISNNNFSNVVLPGTASFYGIDCRTSNNTQMNIITSNIISNITAGGSIKGIYQSYGAAGSTVNNNVITGLINTGGAVGASNSVTGIMLGSNGASASLTVYDNSISVLKGAEPVYGIWNQNGVNNNIFRNKIFNIRSNSTGVGPVYGMIINGGTTTNIYNNFISDLISPFASGDYVIMGVYVAAGTNVNMYYNTIYLNASTSGTNFGTAGIYSKTTGVTLDMRNNIVVNTSNHLGNTGYTVAYRRFDIYMDTYAATSNNNDFYVSSDKSYGNYIYCDGSSTAPTTVKDSTLAQYQATVFPRDAASFSQNPPFINAATIPYDLHIQSSVPTQCESGGARVTTPIAITTDFDGDLRWGEPGYPGTGTAPDVGADEFGVLPVSLSALVTNAVCATSNDGAIDLTVSGGVTPYSYYWGNSATTQDLTGLAPGTYAVTVTDFASVQTTGSWTVGQAGTVCNYSTVSGTVGNTSCYNAIMTLTVSGLTVTAPDGHVELISGQNILIMPGTVVESGAYLWGHISTTYCTQPLAPMVSTGNGSDEQTLSLSNPRFTLYPNPTSGNITLVQKSDREYSDVTVEIFNISGGKILTGQMIGEKRHEFSTSELPTGIYFVKIVADDYVETIKLIKSR